VVLWRAACENHAGNLDQAQHLSERALEITKGTGYIGQHLQSVLWASGFLRSTERNWQDTRAGLKAFWADLNNPFHAYESYSELAFLAEDAQKWHLRLHLWREALGMIEKTPDRSYRAAAHYMLAVAAMKVREVPEAEAELRIASQQVSMLPRKSVVWAEIGLAAVEVHRMPDDGPVNAYAPGVMLPDKSDVYTTIEATIQHFKLIMEGAKVPAGEVYSYTEGGNGELGFYLVSDGSGTPYRVRIRPPCYPITGGLQKLITGRMLSDIIPTFGSLNMIGGECDH
jgi:tetratricopeptide (TPR) repeat protein